MRSVFWRRRPRESSDSDNEQGPFGRDSGVPPARNNLFSWSCFFFFFFSGRVLQVEDFGPQSSMF